MANRPTRSRKPDDQPPEPPGRRNRTEYVYRGRTIVVEYHDEHDHNHLEIDGVRIHFEQTEDGIHSHDSMFMTYGSPFELAEDLIRQWGETGFAPGETPPPHGHTH